MNSFKTLVASFALAAFTSPAFAQIETAQPSGYVGVLLGYSDLTNADARFGYGVDAGLRFPNGITGTLWGYGSSASTNGVDQTLTQYGLGLEHSLGKWFGDRFAALKAGVKAGFSDLNVESPGRDTQGFAYGPSLGWDYVVASGFSVGANADLLFVTGGSGYSTLYLFITGKYWF